MTTTSLLQREFDTVRGQLPGTAIAKSLIHASCRVNLIPDLFASYMRSHHQIQSPEKLHIHAFRDLVLPLLFKNTQDRCRNKVRERGTRLKSLLVRLKGAPTDNTPTLSSRGHRCNAPSPAQRPGVIPLLRSATGVHPFPRYLHSLSLLAAGRLHGLTPHTGWHSQE